MKLKLAAVLTVGLLVCAVVTLMGLQPGAHAQEKKAKQAVEYKVIFAPVSFVNLQFSKQEDGGIRKFAQGPKESAEAMTVQFNALAAEGWEYAGLIATSEQQGQKTGGVLVLFKRAKQ